MMNESEDLEAENIRRSSSRIFFLVTVLCILVAVAVTMVVIFFYFGMSLPDD